MSMKVKVCVLLAVLAALFVGVPLGARAAGVKGTQGLSGQQAVSKTLSFYNTHTHERATIEHGRRGLPVSNDTLAAMRKVMMDHRSGETKAVEPKLIDLLAEIQAELLRRHPGKKIEFHIISGYRSPQSNASMRAKGGGQAKNSRHMHGDAMDIRIPGIATTEVRDVAYCLKRGGVGMYKGSDFVHVDVWTVRTWNWTPPQGLCGKATS